MHPISMHFDTVGPGCTCLRHCDGGECVVCTVVNCTQKAREVVDDVRIEPCMAEAGAQLANQKTANQFTAQLAQLSLLLNFHLSHSSASHLNFVEGSEIQTRLQVEVGRCYLSLVACCPSKFNDLRFPCA